MGTVRRPPAWLVFLAWMVAATAAYAVAHVTGPRWLNGGPVFNLIGASPVVALLVGARRRPARRRLPWYLFAAGQLLFVAGDVLAYNYHRLFGTELPFPSVADVLYLAFYPLLVGGILLLIRETGAARDRGSVVDALTITVGAAAVSWTYLMSPYAHDASLGVATKLISLAYPSMDVLVLGVLVRLLVTQGRQAARSAVLVGGTAMLLATDAVYGWMLLHGGYETGGVLDVGWSAFYALLGVAALQPARARPEVPSGGVAAAPLTWKRIVVLAVASLAAPAMLLTRDLPSEASLDTDVLAAASAVMFALVLSRMAGLMRSREEAVRRGAERAADLAAAERGARAKDRFVSQVSHELRTPLTSILGYLELLQEEAQDGPRAEETAAHLAVVVRNTDRLLRLVDDLLLVARLDDGRFALEESDVDLARVAAEGVEAARPAAELRHVALVLSASGELTVRGDHNRLAQVVDNLLSNAIKFTPEDGRVMLDVTRSNGTATLVVADTGVGIRPDELVHVFERFYRTETATSGAVQGTGLGLPIAKAIVEAHGGTIVATSEPGLGTSFTVRLPVVPQPR